MPNPTTNPKPSPKPPPVCKKGPNGAGVPPVPFFARYLTAIVKGQTPETGLPDTFQGRIRLDPDADPGVWAGDTEFGDLTVEIAVLKHPTADTYAVQIYYYATETPYWFNEWLDVTPKKKDPLSLPPLTFKDPLTADEATVTIYS